MKQEQKKRSRESIYDDLAAKLKQSMMEQFKKEGIDREPQIDELDFQNQLKAQQVKHEYDKHTGEFRIEGLNALVFVVKDCPKEKAAQGTITFQYSDTLARDWFVTSLAIAGDAIAREIFILRAEVNRLTMRLYDVEYRTL